MYHLMTCGVAPNCTWTDLAMPTIAGVNCAKHWEESIKSVEDSMKEESGSLSKGMGMLPPCNLPTAIIVVIQYSGRLR